MGWFRTKDCCAQTRVSRWWIAREFRDFFASQARQLATLVALLVGIGIPGAVFAQVSGNVFQDSNGDGVQASGEIGVESVTVTAYFANGTNVATSTNSSGVYSFTVAQIPSGSSVRLEFTGLPNGFFSGPQGSGSGTNVQFVTAPSTSANLGAYYPCEYCQSNPRILATNYYTSLLGDNAAAGLYYGSSATIVSFDYNSRRSPPNAFNHSNWPNPTTPDYSQNTIDITSVGNIQAIAIQRRTKRIFLGSMASNLWLAGSGGIGQIYLADYSGAGSMFVSQAPFVNVAGLPGVNLNPSSVATNRVGEYGLGGLAVSEDDKTLFAINMGQRTIEMMSITVPASSATPPTTSVSIPLPSTACTNGVFRANATTVHRNKLFVAGVCDASTGTATDLKGVVLEYALAGLSAASSPAATHSFALDYQVNSLFPKVWSMVPWNAATVTSATAANGFQPMVTGIAFVDDGAMVIGIMPRVQYNAAIQAAGFSVRLHPSGNTYALENNGVSGPYTSTARDPSHLTTNPNQSWPVNDGVVDGPGGKWFFEQGLGNSSASISGGNVHPQLFSGGLTVVPGTGEIVMGVADPLEFNSWGVRYHDWATGRANFGHITGLSKASLIGDVEALCEVAPIEIGNRVWRDLNGNGIQDANEPGIAGVTVRLFSAANAVIATAVTNTGGEYYFVSGESADADPSDHIGIVNGGILEATAYQIRIDNAADFAGSGALANTTLSPQDAAQPANGNAPRSDNDAQIDVADSDAALVSNPSGSPAGNFPVVSITTGTAGNNNHSIDFGFVPLPSVSGRVYVETASNATDNNPTGASATTDPGLVTQVAISCVPANAYAGPSSITTGSDGLYSFNNILPGAVCAITETQVAGYTNAYNAAGPGGVNTAGDGAGSTANGVITVTVPVAGSPLNNFAQQSADMTSSIVCQPPNPVTPGAQLTCTITCTNAGPGNAVGASCLSPNTASLPGYVAGSCPLANQTVASAAQISCNFQINAPANGVTNVQGATGAQNDTNGGTAPSSGNNPSSTAVSVAGVNVSGRVYVEGSTPSNTSDNGNTTDPGLIVAVAINCTSPSYAASMNTNADGTYLFAGVPAGASCTITETQPSGYTNAYVTPGATSGSPSNPAESVGSASNSLINIVVPNGGSSGNNFAEQGADMVSSTSCSLSNTPSGAQASCTVTCTNNGPGAAANAFCVVANAASLPNPSVTCAPNVTSLATNATLVCNVTFSILPGSSFSVVGGTGANNDGNGGSTPSSGNNPSAAAVGLAATAVPTLTPLAFVLLLMSMLAIGIAFSEKRRVS
jgi:SdrD B-like domain